MATDHPTEDRPETSLSCVQFLHGLCLEQGGVVQMVLDICQALVDRGHQVFVLTCDATDVPAGWRTGGPGMPQLVELQPSRIPGDWISRSSLHKARSIVLDADIVHLHTPWSLGNLQLARLRRADNKPFVVTIHGMLDDWCMAQRSLKKRTFLTLTGRHFLESAARIHFTAERERQQALRWIPKMTDRTFVAPCFFDLSPYDELPGPEVARAALPGLHGSEPAILFLSRLHPKKGIELLIDAAAILREKGQSFQLLIAGPGEAAYQETLAARASERGIADSIHFLGMIRGREKLSLYQAADLFVLPTQQENFGIVLAEALACGTPVVTTKGTDIWGEIEEAGGFIVPRDARKLANTVERLLADASLRQQRGQQGRQYVYKWLARDRVAKQYEQLYTDAING